jgi:phenylalanyl-tRNA synthetase beta chain
VNGALDQLTPLTPLAPLAKAFMKILTTWLRALLPDIAVDDHQLAEDLTLRGIAVEGIHDLGETAGVSNGSLYEMDITTNRVDAMNHYGVAREVAAIYGLTLPPGAAPLPAPKTAAAPFSIAIEAQDACGRFTARVLRGVNIQPIASATGPISQYATRMFKLLEQKQISNAVDASNFAWLAMGQPTHAFDLDKIEGGIVVRRARKGEKLKTLDGVERTLDPEDLIVADHVKPLGLAGVMGGWETMITRETKNVLVEAAWFDQVAVRRTARRHGLHTDASHRFERGADINAVLLASDIVSARKSQACCAGVERGASLAWHHCRSGGDFSHAGGDNSQGAGLRVERARRGQLASDSAKLAA